MRHTDVETLDATVAWWVPAVIAPRRDWAGAPGCRRGARFLIDSQSCRPARANYPCFDSRSACLEWILAHRTALVHTAPEAAVAPVNLARWLLGLA
jgi:hypothetical protein